MKNIISAIIIICCYTSIFGQQREHFTQYMVNPFVLNPAIAGSNKYLDIKTGYRLQWAGMNGAPVTYYVSAATEIGRDISHYSNHYAYEHKNWHGIGLYAFNDVTGPTSRGSVNFAYAYHITLKKNIHWSFGTFIGTQQARIDGDQLIYGTPPTDPIVTEELQLTPDITFGTYLYGDNYFVGFSANQLANNRLNFLNLQKNIPGDHLFNHYYITAGTKFNLDDYNIWKIQPSFMLKIMSPAPLSIDINALVFYKDIFWFGGSMRVGDSFSALVGTTINNYIDFGYSYDANVSKLSMFNSGSHEIILGLRINYKDKVKCAVF